MQEAHDGIDMTLKRDEGREIISPMPPILCPNRHKTRAIQKIEDNTKKFDFDNTIMKRCGANAPLPTINAAKISPSEAEVASRNCRFMERLLPIRMHGIDPASNGGLSKLLRGFRDAIDEDDDYHIYMCDVNIFDRFIRVIEIVWIDGMSNVDQLM